MTIDLFEGFKEPSWKGMDMPSDNPLLKDDTEPVADPGSIAVAHVELRRRRQRDLRDLRRKESAAEAIAGLARDDTEIFGLTRGQFSLIDLLEAVLAVTGPASVDVSTWTAANTDVSRALELIEAGSITAARWLVDLTFTRRSPQLAARIREAFGKDAIRVSRVHAKFLIVRNEAWDVVVRTSMNLNQNPRLEDFTVGHDPELSAFLRAALDDLWSRQRRDLAEAPVPEVYRWFDEHG